MKLVVVQDTFLIQTYSGGMGNVFKKIFNLAFFLRLNIILFFLKITEKQKFIIVLPDHLNFNFDNKTIVFKYSEALAKVELSKYRSSSISLMDKIVDLIEKAEGSKAFFKSVNLTDIWYTQVASRLSYGFFSYCSFFEDLLKTKEIDQLITLGCSKEEKIAELIAKKNKIRINCFSLFDIAPIYDFVQGLLNKRTLKNKLGDFILKSKKRPLNKMILKKDCFILSVDFFRHLKILVPLYKTYKKHGRNVYFVLDDLKAVSILEKIYGIKDNWIYAQHFMNPSEATKLYSKFSKDFTKTWSRIKNLSSNDKYLKTALEIMETFLKPQIAYGLPMSVLYLTAINRLLDSLSPRGIICHNDMRPAESSLLYLAKKFKTKTLIAHSEILSNDLTNRFDSDYFSATGKNIKNELMKLGYPQIKIFVNGDPRLDFLADRQKKPNNFVYRKLGINITKKIILLISDKPHSLLSLKDKEEQFKSVYQAVKDLKECQLVVKPHPTEDRLNLIEYLKMWGLKDVVVSDNKELELFDILPLTSTVIIGWSMVGFEAMLFKIPVIIANFTSKNYDIQIPYIKGEGAVEVKSIEAVKDCLKKFIDPLNSERIKQINNGLKFCSNYYQLPLGKASEKVYRILN